MKKVPLTQNKVALIDDEDYKLIFQYKWYANTDGNIYYAKTHDPNNNKKIIKMHRVIMNPRPNEEVDHKNGNGLDNRRCNLRIATRSQQTMNTKKYKNCSSKYKGVSRHEKNKKWQVYIRINRKNKYLGCFNSEIEAAIIYNKVATKYFGEFARLNVI